MLALKQQGVPFLAYNIPGKENTSVVDARSAACAGVATTIAIRGVEGEAFQKRFASAPRPALALTHALRMRACTPCSM